MAVIQISLHCPLHEQWNPVFTVDYDPMQSDLVSLPRVRRCPECHEEAKAAAFTPPQMSTTLPWLRIVEMLERGAAGQFRQPSRGACQDAYAADPAKITAICRDVLAATGDPIPLFVHRVSLWWRRHIDTPTWEEALAKWRR